MLASILWTAREKYHLMSDDPMEHIQLPRPNRGNRNPKPNITPEQFDELVNSIPEPYATMVYVAIYSDCG